MYSTLTWADDNKTLSFGELKMAEVIDAVDRTAGLSGALVPEVTFDLSEVQGSVFSTHALPLVILARDLQLRGVEVSLELPTNSQLRQLFLNTNWANLISPHQHASSAWAGKHMPATPYSDSKSLYSTLIEVEKTLLENFHLPISVFRALVWCLNEVTDNVLLHSKSSEGGLVQLTVFKEYAHLVVADGGVGIATSMRTAFDELKSDEEAVRRALEPRVTSGPGAGIGLAGLHRITQLARGQLSFLTNSTRASLQYESQPEEEWFTLWDGKEFPGTCVILSLPLASEIDLRDALSFQVPDWEPPWTIIESQYGGDESGLMRLDVKDIGETSTRVGGRKFRTILLNLLGSESKTRVEVDFFGVEMVSSSWADEAFAKLSPDLTSSDRVRFIGMNEETKIVVTNSISNRRRET